MDTVTDDLETARLLARSGVPIFVAPADDSHPLGVRLPRGWQHTPADPTTVDSWTPGDALCAVMGHSLDGLDRDPHKGGELPDDTSAPRSYGRASTPSGGTHDLIAPLGVHSRDGVAPGVDVKAGDDDGGRGFLFIAPTRRRSKVTGEVEPYTWTSRPDPDELAELSLLGDDGTGHELAELVRSVPTPDPAADPATGYAGPTFDELTPARQIQAREHVQVLLDTWAARLADAARWPEGHRDDRGRGWESLARDFAWALAMQAACPWSPIDVEAAETNWTLLLPAEIAEDPSCGRKLTAQLFAKARTRSIDLPPWERAAIDFGPAVTGAGAWPEIPTALDDASMAAWFGARGLDGRWAFSGATGWMCWDGRVWAPRGDHDAREAVRRAALEVCGKAIRANVSPQAMKAFYALRSASKINSLTHLLKGVVAVDPSAFDTRPDLLNVANGVVDLATGQLGPHDPTLLLTRITETRYVPGARHPDWDKALTSLDPEVRDWMQIRFGQAATGWPTSDDILPICQGGGQNGKSTLVAGIKVALGEHATLVPEKLLRAGPNDHPTELMSLHGVRVAIVDETPEVAHLNVARLKAVLGQEWMTARAIRKDNVTWRSTHSLVLMSNYVPRVTETDHGTWRRLALVRFERKFPRDDSFRARISSGAHGIAEAVLAWIVDGARRWFAEDRVIPLPPSKVEADTEDWRGESDLVMAYVADRLEFDPDASVTSTDLLDDVNEWLTDHRHRPWSDQLLASRFGSHDVLRDQQVVKTRPKFPPSDLVRRPGSVSPLGVRPTIWRGIRWAEG